jgi:hypothetical protein
MGSKWILGRCGLDSTVSGQGPMEGYCECGDEPSGSCATELVSHIVNLSHRFLKQPSNRSIRSAAQYTTTLAISLENR